MSKPRTTKPQRPQQEGKWASEHKALKKIQVHFELQQSMLHDIRVKSAFEDMIPSDYVRRVVGLPYTKIQRPRISLSFSDEDLRYLSERYDVDLTDQAEIKRRVKHEIEEHLTNKSW